MRHYVNISSNCGRVWQDFDTGSADFIRIPRIGEHYICQNSQKWLVTAVSTEFLTEEFKVRVNVKVTAT